MRAERRHAERLSKPHRRPGDGHEHQHGRRNGDRQRLGAAQGKCFRHKLAGHNVKVRDQAKTQHKGGCIRIEVGVRQHAEPWSIRICAASGSPSQPKSQRAKRYAQLHGGKKIVQIELQPAHGPRSRNPRFKNCATRVSRMETSANSAATK